MAKNNYILGIDVGGTNTRFGLVTAQGKLIKLEQLSTPKSKHAIINFLIKKIQSFQNEASKVGLGLPGPLDLKSGTILKTPNLPLSSTPILNLLKKKIKLPIRIDNDANCFVLAEALRGAGKNYRKVVGLTLGTGIGGGIVFDKKIYHGRSNAGELGHQFIDFKRAKDLEDFSGARKLKLSPLDYQRLEKLARKKDKKALKFWHNLGLTLGFGLVNLIHILDPDIIILGGKQAKAYNFFYPSLIKTIKKYCLVKPPRIVKSKLIDKGGVIGAALLFK